jgi:tRNA (mo5U34)-methyltransferase
MLLRRAWRKMANPVKPDTPAVSTPSQDTDLATSPPPAGSFSVPAALKEKYAQLVANFQARTLSLVHCDVSHYYWYHTIDLGDGLVTPGDHDYRSDLPLFQFPADMRGMNVLDVGSATGFFAFEFEKRGAIVTSVELPSLAAWDMPIGEQAQRTIEYLRQYHGALNAAEAYHRHLDGPFLFCHQVLKSAVRRCYSSVYDLTGLVLDRTGFDLVFVGDILLHLMSPLKALAVLAPLCTGTMVIAQELADEVNPQPSMRYIGGDQTDGDCRNWWLPNRSCLEQMLKRLGFSKVSTVGHYSGIVRRLWEPYCRTIVHAIR